MARLGAEANACGGTPTKRASAYCLVCITGFVPSHRRVRGARSEAAGMLPGGYREPDA